MARAAAAKAKTKTSKAAAPTAPTGPSRSTAARRGRPPGRPRASAPVPDEALILARGLETFAELGYEGASVRELARRLDVSHNFINDRYGSKDGFWRAVVDAVLGGVDDGLTKLLQNDQLDDLARLRGVVRYVAGLAGPHPQLQLLLSQEAARGSPRLLYIFERYIQPFTLRLSPVIAGLVRDGVIRPVPWHVLFFLLTAPRLAQGQQPLAELLGRSRNDTDNGALFADLIVNALLVPARHLPTTNDGL